MRLDAPLSFVPKRWSKYVVGKDAGATVIVKASAYELALLTTLNERIKSGDVTLVGSRRWGDFEDYLIPVEQWERERTEHYRVLQLPIIADEFVEQLQKRLATVTREVDDRVPQNQWLTIDAERQHFPLAALRGQPAPSSVSTLKRKIEARLRRIELADLLIDIDSETNFLRHFLHFSETRLSVPERRRNVLAALIATGCNIGPQRMAAASGMERNQVRSYTGHTALSLDTNSTEREVIGGNPTEVAIRTNGYVDDSGRRSPLSNLAIGVPHLDTSPLWRQYVRRVSEIPGKTHMLAQLANRPPIHDWHEPHRQDQHHTNWPNHLGPSGTSRRQL